MATRQASHLRLVSFDVTNGAWEITMKEEQGCIYEIRCLIGKKKGYVGQHCRADPKRRLATHIREAFNGSMLPIHCAIRKYGPENFSAEAIWKGAHTSLNKKETFYIDKLHTFVDDPKGGGYNLTRGGEGIKNPSKELRARLSESIKLVWASRPDLRIMMSAVHKGKKNAHTPAQIEAARTMGRLHKGRKRSPETCAKMSAARRKLFEDSTFREKHAIRVREVFAADPTIGKRISASNKGRKLSPEHCEKVSKALNRYHETNVVSKETKAAISKGIRAAHKRDPTIAMRCGLGNRGKVRTPEQRAKVSASRKGIPAWNKGKKMTAEARENNRAAQLRYRAQIKKVV